MKSCKVIWKLENRGYLDDIRNICWDADVYIPYCSCCGEEVDEDDFVCNNCNAILDWSE